MATDASRVKRYFERVTVGFDRIYDSDRSSLKGMINRWRRRSMFERFRVTVEVCGDVRGKRVLDIGCGSGRYSVELARRGAEVVGVDFSQPMLDLAARAAEAAGVAGRCRFLHGEILQLAFAQRFDISLAIGVFDYTDDPHPLLQKMRELTCGTLIASFPVRAHPLALVRKLRLFLAGCPVRFYTRAQVERLLRWPGSRAGLQTLGRDYLAVVHG
ncbi:MAG: class I SAM-dependent methyltransferase [Candidatus Omnitrophica bacterium]|nr:class I SAM-dependent methyltransferase [Candidatus Omnitrophota bacterium]